MHLRREVAVIAFALGACSSAKAVPPSEVFYHAAAYNGQTISVSAVADEVHVVPGIRIVSVDAAE